MIDYYLKVEKQEDMPAIPEGAVVDIIGEWYDGEVKLDGFFFNVRSATEIVWPENVTVEQPVTPWRVWA